MKNPTEIQPIKKAKKFVLGRTLVVGISILAQLLWISIMIYRFSLQFSYIDAVRRRILVNGKMRPLCQIIRLV